MAELGILSVFPAELLDQILNELCKYHVNTLREELPDIWDRYWKDAKKCLAALVGLCLASKRCNQLATWRLYRSITPAMLGLRWLLLARTLISRPDLAGLVRHLALDDDVFHYGSVPREVMQYYTRKLAENPGCRFTNPEDDGADAAVPVRPIIISLCPNLSSFKYTTVLKGAEFAFLRPGSLQSLREFECEYCDTEMAYALEELQLLFRAAPNLTYLHLDQTWGGDASEGEDLRLEKVTELTVTLSAVPAEDFIGILRLCPNVGRLVYCGGDPCNGDEQFTPTEAAKAVIRYAPKLRYFELDLFEWANLDLGEFDADDMRAAKRALERRGIECRFTMELDRTKGDYFKIYLE